MNSTDFQLIETMLYNGEIEHLDLHLLRLKKSSEHFHFSFDMDRITGELEKKTAAPDIPIPSKVRLLLNESGSTEITVSQIEGIPGHFSIAVSPIRTHSSNIFLYHKTTNRELYNTEFQRARKNGYFDIIFINEKDEISEGAITNIYMKKDGILITPPVSSGLLSGTIRTRLLSLNKAVEGIIHLNDVKDAEEVYISNSVIGLRNVINHKEIQILSAS